MENFEFSLDQYRKRRAELLACAKEFKPSEFIKWPSLFRLRRETIIEACHLRRLAGIGR